MNGLNEFISPTMKGDAVGESDRGKLRAKNNLVSSTIKFVAVVLAVTTFTEISQAQNSGNTSPALRTKSIGNRFDTTSNQNRFDITAGLSIDDITSSPLQSNTTVNDTFIRTERQQGSLTLIYNTYNQNYVDNVVSQRAIDSLDLGDSVSKQIAAYEGTIVMSRVLSASPMANIFASFSEDLRAVRDAMMFRVGPSQNGEIQFEPSKKYGKTPNFIELRLTPNTRDGIQPRLRFGENVSLAHDFTGSTTFLEYNINF